MDIISILKNEEFYTTMRECHINLYESAYCIANALDELTVGYTLTGGSQLCTRRNSRNAHLMTMDLDLAISETDLKKLCTQKNLLHLSCKHKIILIKVDPFGSYVYGSTINLGLVQNQVDCEFSSIVTSSVVVENNSIKRSMTYQNKEIDLGLKDIDLFLHITKNKMLEYNHLDVTSLQRYHYQNIKIKQNENLILWNYIVPNMDNT